MSVQYVPYRRNGKWLVIWKNPWTGKKHRKGFEDEALARSFDAAQADIAARERTLLRRARKKKDSRNRITVAELLEMYTRMAPNNPKTSRQTQYHAVQILTAFGTRQAALLTPQDIFNFSEAQRLRGIKQLTVNRRVSILRTALNWAVRNCLLKENPLNGLKLPRAHAQRIAPPTAMEAQAMLAVASPHVQRVIIMGLCTGPRIGPSELFRLEWKDVDFVNATIRMPSAQKNYRDAGRDIPIRKTLMPLLKAWHAHDQKHGISYVISWGKRPVKCVGHAWHEALKKAGITRRIRPYDLRHAFATYALAGSADIGSVAQLMGHTDASMILKTYQHVQDAQKRAAVEAGADILCLADTDMQKNILGI